ncbi:hypothetical protein VIGAN_01127100, partial [Vigna angularis var. angularis]
QFQLPAALNVEKTNHNSKCGEEKPQLQVRRRRTQLHVRRRRTATPRAVKTNTTPRATKMNHSSKYDFPSTAALSTALPICSISAATRYCNLASTS